MTRPDAASPPWSARAEFAATTAFWGLLTALMLVRSVLSPRGPVALSPGGLARTGAEYAFWIALTPLVFALARRYPLERGRVVRHLLVLLVVGVVIAAAVELCRAAVFRALIDSGALPDLPSSRGRPGFRLSPVESVLRLQFVDELVIYAGVLAAGFARGYALRAVERETEAARLAARAASLEGELTDARLAALRMQLNPHFLFNALNAVSAYVERDPERAQTMIAQLGGLLRRVLDGDARPEVSLGEEQALLRDYVAIQEARFGPGLVVTWDVDADALDALVPALVLQPLAENAVEHGVSRLVGVAGRIHVSARRERAADGAERLVLAVADNGPGLDASSLDRADSGTAPGGSGVGLANTRARLDTLYGDAAGLTLASRPDGGTVATVSLPYRPAPRA